MTPLDCPKCQEIACICPMSRSELEHFRSRQCSLRITQVILKQASGYTQSHEPEADRVQHLIQMARRGVHPTMLEMDSIINLLLKRMPR